jgi:hypothetical protein
MSDPTPVKKSTEEEQVKMYMEITGASEICARSVVIHLEGSEAKEKDGTEKASPDPGQNPKPGGT